MALKDRSSFGGSGITAPNLTASINAVKSVSDMIGEEQDRILKKNQLTIENQRAADMLALKQNADTRAQGTYDMNMSEFDRLKGQRTASVELGQMGDPQNLKLQARLNEAYGSLANQADTLSKDEYNKRLLHMNNQLATNLGDGTEVDNTKAAYALDRDPLAFEEQATAQLLASGNFTPVEAKAVVDQELARRYPVASAESITAAQGTAENIYKERMKLLGKGLSKDGTTVNINGQEISTGANGNKTVISTADATEKIEKMMEGRATDADFSGWVGKKLFGNNPATRNTIMEYVDYARKADVPPHAILAQLQTSVSENAILDDSIDIDKDTFVNAAKENHVKGKRLTTNGVAGAGLGGMSMADYQSKASAYEKDYLISIKNAEKSGLRSRTTFEDVIKKYTPPKVVEDKNTGKVKVDKPSTSNDPIVKEVNKKVEKEIKEIPSGKVTPETRITPDGLTVEQEEYVNKVTADKDGAYRSAVINQLKLLNDPNMSDKDRLTLHAKIASNIVTSTFADIGHAVLGTGAEAANVISNFSKRQDEKAANKPYTSDEIVNYLRGDTQGQKDILKATMNSGKKNTIGVENTSVTDGITFPAGQPGQAIPKSPQEIVIMKKSILTNLPNGVTKSDINKLSDREIINLFNRMKANL